MEQAKRRKEKKEVMEKGRKITEIMRQRKLLHEW